MSWIEALILGLIQGLTEFLPVSSSGHLEIGKAIFNIHSSESLIFTVVVHAATVLSIFIVFRKKIIELLKSLFTLKNNEKNKYSVKLLLSAVPVVIIGLLFEKDIEKLFTGNIILVGSLLLITGLILTWAHYSKDGKRKINFIDALIIGIAQAIAVLPGISRSGATISAALILGNKKSEAANFSFLMVMIPILGAVSKTMYDIIIKNDSNILVNTGITPLALIVGFFAAFVSGFIACKWMLKIVENSKLIYFTIYCSVVGIIAICFGIF